MRLPSTEVIAEIRDLASRGYAPSWIGRRLKVQASTVEKIVGQMLLERSRAVPAHPAVLLPSSIPPIPLSRLMAGR